MINITTTCDYCNQNIPDKFIRINLMAITKDARKPGPPEYTEFCSERIEQDFHEDCYKAWKITNLYKM